MNRIGAIWGVGCAFFVMVWVGEIEGTEDVRTPTNTGKTKVQLLNELRLRKAEVDLDRRREDLKNKKRELEIADELFKEKIYMLKELNDAQKAFEEASVLYKQAVLTLRETKLNFLRDATHISVMEAKKYILPDGRRMVDVTLKNSSNVSEAETYLSGTSELAETGVEIEGLDALDQDMSKARLTSLLEIQNIIVSIYQGGTIIGKPYDQIVPSLKLYEEKSLTFQLLDEEADQITIQMEYLDVTKQMPVKVEAESEKAIPILEVMQFSQEADLGESATYAVRVERFSSGRAAFQLAVVNLPKQINAQFTRSGARLSQINFRQNETSHDLSLQVYLPERSDADVAIDKRIEFYALVLPQAVWRRLQPIHGRMFSAAELDTLDVSKVKLELVPRGVGRIEVRAVNLYHEISIDEEVSMEVTVYNDGTRRLDNVAIRANMPPNWRSMVEPDVISELLPSKERAVQLTFIPPDDVGVGDYEVQIQTQAMADNRPVETQDKTVRIHVTARTNLLLSSMLILGVIGLVVGVVWYGVKLTRR